MRARVFLFCFLWIAAATGADTANSISVRIAPPEGYQRMQQSPGSFGAWLSQLPLKPGNPPVHLYNGSLKRNQEAHFAVVDMDTGSRDLQQCADAVMRLRAEYLWAAGKPQDIRFHFTSWDVAEFSRWSEGYRPSVRGNSVTWSRSASKDTSYANFRRYLDTVFTYSGSYSLSRELTGVNAGTMQPGDVFINGGFPGHAVIVVDMAVNPQTGKKIFLLAQSYMPAQEIHVLKNPENSKLSPWYDLDFGDILATPEWTFTSDDLKRW